MLFDRCPAAQVNEEQYTQRQLRVEDRHVLRAFDQVKLCHDLIGVFTRGCIAAPRVVPQPSPVSQALSSAARLDAALEGQRLPVSQFDPFEFSQASMASQGLVDVDGETEKMLTLGKSPNLDEGYGEGGVSVQPAPVLWKDRDAWQSRKKKSGTVWNLAGH